MTVSTASLKSAFSHFLTRYHMIIFTVVVLGGLVVCMFLINAIIAQTGGENSANLISTGATSASFDQQTIDRIKQLHTADDTTKSNLDLSSGRVNPFVD